MPQRQRKRKSHAADSADEGRGRQSKRRHNGKQKESAVEVIEDEELEPDKPDIVNDELDDVENNEIEVSL